MHRQVSALIIALLLHESAHLTAAACMHIPIPEIKLMPFGGAASIGNPYSLSPVRLGITAAAGPAAGIIAVFVTATLARWHILRPEDALLFIRTNLMLSLFNLIPALPLDGGRILYALLRKKTGPDRAVEAGIWVGRILAVCLLTGAVHLFISCRMINLSYIFFAVFLISSASGERSALLGANDRIILSALSPISSPMPTETVAVDASCTLRMALKSARPGTLNLFIVYKDGIPLGFTDDRRISAICLANGSNSPIGQTPLFMLLSDDCKKSRSDSL